MRYAKDTLTLYYKQEKHTLTSDNEKIYDTIPITAKSEIRVLENSMEAIPILNQLSDQLEGFELQQGTMDDDSPRKTTIMASKISADNIEKKTALLFRK